MKKLHLLCNSHIDPVWLWRKNEGIATTLSTFRVAADFCEQYEGFVFNHNEALLYEWVEEYEPELFERIKRLVAEGKWKIMGGWYLQPDCVMTSGESLISQMDLGYEYFTEKFGVYPKTAINFDPFGHTRGLVQLLKRKGFDNYLFMRPENIKDDFWWEGFDGSRVLGHGMYQFYSTQLGQAADKVTSCIEDWKYKDIGLCLWGIGNHGGGPSRVELEAVNEIIAKSDVEIIHSDADTYMNETDRSNLPVIKKSLGPVMVGCYTSQVRIKQANRRVENKIALTEKALCYAGINADEKMREAKKTLAFCQFHDILPGTSIKPVEDDSLRAFDHAEEIADQLYNRAFFALCEGQPKCKSGEIPVLIFNPHPYEIEGEFQVEFILEYKNLQDGDVNEAKKYTIAKMYDSDGNFLPTQNEKPHCTLHLDWTKRIAFRAKLAPSSVTRYDCKMETVEIDTLKKKDNTSEYITVENGRMYVSISRKTGLIEKYCVDGKTYIENSAKLVMYDDNEDPWGMEVESFCSGGREYSLMSDDEVNEFCGYAEENCPNVRISEEGDVRVKVQAFFRCGKNIAIVEYTIPKGGTYVDVNIKMFSNEVLKMTKFVIDTKINGTPYGETAFGYEEMALDNKESVFHKWCGIKSGDDALYVINNGTYGGSFTENSISLSVLRTPIYAAHPIDDRQRAPHDKYIEHIDMGERNFSFRITTEQNIAREAQIFNEAPQTISFFPSGNGKKCDSVVNIDNPKIIMSSIRSVNDGYKLTLYNSEETETNATVSIGKTNKELHFGKFELREIVLKP